ncbi:MAG: amidase [Burkholderiaceae bacterium]
MTSFNVREESIPTLQDALSKGVCSSQDLVQAYLQRIAAYDQAGPCLNAIVALHPRALQLAKDLDQERHEGYIRGPLHGIPILVKDNFGTYDLPTTGGSKALSGLQTLKDAELVRRLKASGAIILGKTTLHELAVGITNASSLTGYTRNPYDPRYIPGGSSGGTAVAIAASYAAAGLGTDTSGSIRVPAACQNLYGLRPTSGLVSRNGIIPLCPTQDIGGPIARTVADLSILLDAIVGPDPGDPATHDTERYIPASYFAGLQVDNPGKLRIGLVTDLFGQGANEREITCVVESALEEMRQLGATLVPLHLPDLEDLILASSLIKHEFKFALADFLNLQPNPPVRSLGQLLDLNLHHAEVDTVLRLRNQTASRDTPARTEAVRQRGLLQTLVIQAMSTHKLDALAYPTLRSGPVKIGEAQPGQNCGLSPALGWPALSLPAGFTTQGLPVGLDLLARPFSEEMLLQAAYSWEQSGRRRKPPVLTP